MKEKRRKRRRRKRRRRKRRRKRRRRWSIPFENSHTLSLIGIGGHHDISEWLGSIGFFNDGALVDFVAVVVTRGTFHIIQEVEAECGGTDRDRSRTCLQ
jgi:hypothetical protein